MACDPNDFQELANEASICVTKKKKKKNSNTRTLYRIFNDDWLFAQKQQIYFLRKNEISRGRLQ